MEIIQLFGKELDTNVKKEGTHQFLFDLVSKADKKWRISFSCDSEVDKNMWLRALQEGINLCTYKYIYIAAVRILTAVTHSGDEYLQHDGE